MRELVDEFLGRHLSGERADRALASIMRAHPELTSEQRRNLAEWTLGIALWRGRLDVLANGDRSLWWPLFLIDREHRSLDEVEQLCGVRPVVTVPTFDDPIEQLAFEYSLPIWLARRWIKEFGLPRTQALASAMNARGPISIRVNTLKTNREELRRLLRLEGIESDLSTLAPNGLRLRGRPNIHGSLSWHSGLFEVQDEGSQLIAHEAEVRPGMLVVDLCAGAGGKTLAMAAEMENSGRIVAVDVNPQRLVDLKARAQRGGATCIETREADSTRPLEDLIGQADVVLVDAPCSSTGVLRRGPDARWRLRSEEIIYWSSVQSALLRSGATLVKPGGRLVYATCSLEGVENESVARALAGPRLLSESRTSPDEQGCDGFYRAVWQAEERPSGFDSASIGSYGAAALAKKTARPIAVLRAGWGRRIGVPVFFLAAGFFAAALATGAGYREMALRIGVPVGATGLVLAVGLWRRRAVLWPDRIEVRGLLWPRTVRFDELKVFTYDARTYRLYLPIPIGRVASLTLRGKRGAVVFHAGFSQFDRYIPKLIDQAIDSTVRRMRAEIDRGQSARFGWSISVDRSHVRVRPGLGRAVPIPLDEARFEIADGRVTLMKGKKRIGRFSLRSTPNLLALPQLAQELDAARHAPRPDVLLQALAVG